MKKSDTRKGDVKKAKSVQKSNEMIFISPEDIKKFKVENKKVENESIKRKRKNPVSKKHFSKAVSEPKSTDENREDPEWVVKKSVLEMIDKTKKTKPQVNKKSVGQKRDDNKNVSRFTIAKEIPSKEPQKIFYENGAQCVNGLKILSKNMLDIFKTSDKKIKDSKEIDVVFCRTNRITSSDVHVRQSSPKSLQNRTQSAVEQNRTKRNPPDETRVKSSDNRLKSEELRKEFNRMFPNESMPARLKSAKTRTENRGTSPTIIPESSTIVVDRSCSARPWSGAQKRPSPKGVRPKTSKPEKVKSANRNKKQQEEVARKIFPVSRMVTGKPEESQLLMRNKFNQEKIRNLSKNKPV